MSNQTLIAQAAEAKIYLNENIITKDRISKTYRHPILDKKIIKQRTKREAKLLAKASELIPAPLPENLEEIEKSKFPTKIIMPFIDGKKISDYLEKLDWKSICKKIGNQIAILHDNDIIHGDLTTSNMILSDDLENEKQNPTKLKQNPATDLYINNKNTPIINLNASQSNISKLQNQEIYNINNKIKREGELVQPSNNKASVSEPKLYFIDFGLSFISNRIEDKAVDLHLIKQALEAKHFTIHKEAEKIILENYNSKDKARVLEQLKKVELRGRYKH